MSKPVTSFNLFRCNGNNSCPSEQQWKKAGLCLVSARIPKMNKLASVFLLLFAPGFAWCFPVTAGGNTSLQVFYCKDSGCASNVTQVFCNDKLLFSQTLIADCAGLHRPNTVCQHDDQAFVSIDTPGSCDFEGDSYIKTEKCTDSTSVCAFTSATTSLPFTPKTLQKAQKTLLHYSLGVSVSVLGVVLMVLVLCFYKKRQNREQMEQPASDESEPFSKMQQTRETTLSDTPDDQSRMENGRYPSQYDPEA